MHKVIVITLNGNAYQVDEIGYEALRGYLDRAKVQLEANPDLAEIMADLEQAIAEKCLRFLGPNKTVVSAAEVDQILEEMGPVDAAPGGAAREASDAGHDPAGSAKTRADGGPARRLYQIRDGAMISGVCNGLAAYLNLDVTVIRVAFVILAVITKGVWVAAYFVMMFVIPHAQDIGGARGSAGPPLQRAGGHRAGEKAFQGQRGTVEAGVETGLEGPASPLAAEVRAAEARMAANVPGDVLVPRGRRESSVFDAAAGRGDRAVFRPHRRRDVTAPRLRAALAFH